MANRLQCNLHSCGWISDVGVLYKGIWLPAELHDIQLAPWRVSTHTLTCVHTDAHTCTDTARDGERKRTVCDSYAGLSAHRSPALPDRHRNRYSTLPAWRDGLTTVPHLALCLPKVPVNQHALVLPLAQQLWHQLRKGPIMAVNPADAPGTKQGAR